MPHIKQRGDKFFAQVRVTREGVQVFSSSRSFDTRAKAVAWAEDLESRVKSGKAPRSPVTVGELVLKHLTYLRKAKPPGRSQIQNYEFVAARFDKIRAADITAKDVIDFALERRAEGLAGATVMSNLSPLSAAFHAAPLALGVDVDATEVERAIERLKRDGVVSRSRSVDRPMTEAEEAALVGEFERRNRHHQTSIDMVKVMRLAIRLPRRASELTRLRWADINESDRTIVIRDVKNPRQKKGNDQVVPLVAGAWEALHDFPVEGALILPFNTESMLAAFERARDRIAATGMPGIKDLRFHDLRHHGITRLFRMGLSIQEVALVSGHTQWSTLRRYTHLRARDLHKRLSKDQPENKDDGGQKPSVGGAQKDKAAEN